MNKDPAVDSTRLFSAGRDIKTPFQAFLYSGYDGMGIRCTRVLRSLPGKRLVCSGEKNSEKIVAKFFLNPRKGKKHCLREEQGICALNEAGISTPELVFKGSADPAGNQPVLVFRLLERAINYTDAWQQAETDACRVGLLKNLATVIAKIHSAGLIHNDAHSGNFMVSGNTLYAVDGASVDIHHRGKPLSRVKSIKNLAAVFAQFQSRFGALIFEAFSGYIEKRGWTENSGVVDFLARQIRIQRSKREKKHLKKIYRESSAQVCSKAWGHFMLCKRDCYTPDMARFLGDPDSYISEGKILKAGKSSTVALVKADRHILVVKRYNIKNFWHAISRCPRPSRAWRSWENAHRLSMIEIATPRPGALLEKRWGPFRSRAYFITEYAAGIDG